MVSKTLEACESWDQILDLLGTDEEELRQGGGAEAIQRQHDKGRLTARERIQKLIDPDSEFFELGLFSAFETRCCTIPITSRISGFVCDYY